MSVNPRPHTVAQPSLATPSMTSPLAHFGFVWFVPVMGWIGLTMAWFQPPREESGISLAAQLSSLVTVTLFALVFLTQLIRAWRHPQALLADLRHPVRMAFTASFAIALVLMGTLGTLWGLADEPWVQVIWWAGSLLEFSITVWVMSRCLQPADAGGLAWPAITPLLVIPIVGNVLVPLAGLRWPISGWVSAQFGLGLFLWPLIVGLLLVRLLQAGPLPARMAPTLFILVAPPSAVGLVLLQWPASSLLAWACWGVALMSLLWALSQWRVIRGLPFGMSHWGMSFPLAAFSALCLRLGQLTEGGWLLLPGQFALWTTTAVILWLSAKSLQGLLDGRLLQPEG
jgi:tellurite resistance protein